jgi:hypothetical protein
VAAFTAVTYFIIKVNSIYYLMKKIAYIIFLTIIPSLSLFSQAQVFYNNKASGKIDNEDTGVIRFLNNGSISGMPDTIGGLVEFVDDVNYHKQKIPNVTYNKLTIKGSTQSFVDTIKVNNFLPPLRTRDSLWVYNNALIFVDSNEVHAKGTVINTARVVGKRDLVLKGDSAQTVEGDKGEFRNLNLDNWWGADVVEGGGFLVSRKLELTQGELRNSADNNFTIADSSKIIRHTGASLAHEPEFEDRVDVYYVGDGMMVSGPELPSDPGSLQLLSVNNDGGIRLDRNVTVNDSLYVGAPINGYDPDTDESFTLTYIPRKNPGFSNTRYAEVIGDMKRTTLAFNGDTIIFNNPYTYTIFADSAAAGETDHITMRVVPNQFPKNTTANKFVERTIDVWGFNADGDTLAGAPNMTLGYGWIHQPQSTIVEDETNGLNVPDLLLQYYDNIDWQPQTSSDIPTAPGQGWAYSKATGLSSYGHFAIGLPGSGPFFLMFSGLLMLEGATTDTLMRTDLLAKGLLPRTPIEEYPYTLDPQRENIYIDEFPEDVVDWIVLGFDQTGKRGHFVTCFVRKDGTIVDLNGNPVISLTAKGVDSGRYEISVLHRNHLPLKTQNQYLMNSANHNINVNFTTASVVEGAWGAMKPLYADKNGKIVWGMLAGEVAEKETTVPVITEEDMNATWTDRNREGYETGDVNLNGIVNTEDINFIQNNKRK